jgi:hypothetical protein
MRQEMHRNCTDAAVSSVQTGTMVRQETADQGLFRPTPAQGGCGPDCLRTNRFGVPGRSAAVACRVYVTLAGPSGVAQLGDVVAAYAAAGDQGLASPR